jgi:hypothetical protein
MDDDEARYSFGAHHFTAGECVRIGDDAGLTHTFKVVSVEPAA